MRLLLAPLLLLAMSQAAATDLILYNGKLWTGDAANPSATALAIEDGRITAVGDDATVLKHADAGTERIDLKGRRVIPGINDAHVHLGAWWNSTYLELPSPAPSRHAAYLNSGIFPYGSSAGLVRMLAAAST